MNELERNVEEVTIANEQAMTKNWIKLTAVQVGFRTAEAAVGAVALLKSKNGKDHRTIGAASVIVSALEYGRHRLAARYRGPLEAAKRKDIEIDIDRRKYLGIVGEQEEQQ